MKSIHAVAVVAACVVSFSALPAAAQLHRCTGKDGKVTYTDRECEQGATARGVVIKDSAGFDSRKGTEPAAGPATGTPAAPGAAPKAAPPSTGKPDAVKPGPPVPLDKRTPSQVEEDNKRAHEIMTKQNEERRRAAEAEAAKRK